MTTVQPTQALDLGPHAWVNGQLGAPATRRFLRKYVTMRVPAPDVDDVVQATLCDALASSRAPLERRELERWLLGIARFKVADHHRAAARWSACDPEPWDDPPPLEERSLASWAERQVPHDEGRATLSWMAREAEGEKLEHIAADAKLPPERVRQRVSRLRRWMKARWLAELAAVAAALGMALWARRALAPADQPIAAEVTADTAEHTAPLMGTWRLAAFRPAEPLGEARQALFDRVADDVEIRFDGATVHVVAPGGSLERTYRVTGASPAGMSLADETRGTFFGVELSLDGDILVVTSSGGPLRGVARLRPAGVAAHR